MLILRLLQREIRWPNRFLSVAIGLAVFLSLPMIASAQAQLTAPQEAIEKFCAFEFGGAQDVEERMKLVHFSAARVRDLGKIMDGLSPYVFEWETEPLEVVDSYKVDRITVSGGEATATVTYEVVAKRRYWAGRIEPVPKNAVTAPLQLRLYRGRWKVEDPPYPRVSKRFLSSSYRGIPPMSQSWYQKASREQLVYVRNAINNILLLDDMK